MKGNYMNWGGLFCIGSGIFAIMIVINHSLSNSENSGVYALISLGLAITAIPFLLKVDTAEIE